MNSNSLLGRQPGAGRHCVQAAGTGQGSGGGVIAFLILDSCLLLLRDLWRGRELMGHGALGRIRESRGE